MQEINTLAKTLVSLEDEEKIRQVQGKICELVFERLTDLPEQRKKGNNELTTIRFHLIPGRRFNLEQFNEQLFLSVSKSETGKWRFRPEAGAEYLTYLKFIDENTYVYVSEAVHEEIEKTAKVIMAAGVKYKDACHVACAIKAGCEFFLSTDKRLLKYRSNSIKMLNPIEFIEEMEE